MFYRIGIENNVEGRSLAWALEHPGCFAYGETPELALSAVPNAIVDYSNWLDNRSEENSWMDTTDIGLIQEESWDVYSIDENFEPASRGYEINAWFRYDWKPLTAQDVERALLILAWSRADLLDAVYGLNSEQLSNKLAGERWSIEGILRHVGGAEWWYLGRLGLAFPKSELPNNPLERIESVRSHLIKILPALVGVQQVVGVQGEFWSPRKLLRRAAWHERDHVTHIHKLRN
jgi:hypothetical protein